MLYKKNSTQDHEAFECRLFAPKMYDFRQFLYDYLCPLQSIEAKLQAVSFQKC